MENYITFEYDYANAQIIRLDNIEGIKTVVTEGEMLHEMHDVLSSLAEQELLTWQEAFEMSNDRVAYDELVEEWYNAYLEDVQNQ